MARIAAVAALGLGAEAVTLRAPHGASFLSTGSGLRPDVAAQTLVSVEDEWQAEASIFADCEARGEQEATSDCVKAPKAFKKSCDTVVTAIMQGSSGEKGSSRSTSARSAARRFCRTGTGPAARAWLTPSTRP